MACLGLRSTGGVTIRANRVGDWVKIPTPSQVQVASQPIRAKPMVAKCSASAASIEMTRGSPEKFDHWIQESVGEIVKNLKEAPLFVHVYGGAANTTVKTETAVAENWGHLKGKWVKGEEPSPEGIILVEELKEEDDVGILEGQNGDCTKAWGVLIQGKGEDGGVACYLLKTSRVGCGNLGLFCTHYCLVRVNSFRETARSQLTSCWLV
ncbi:hypothetical protein SOVF_035470 [Spinacia oleracea]|uniref:DUF7804 domain-containing protein n=1 Tax=Spinacia oleracea TaxID=3562 RepID=A0A9R0K8C9_SPIOL|nr:uncharacterized protein LOC110801324 [Spinacia oleracea]KNA22307.1 hypothetical protein SOVF_035470 [Spinacia oleracea]